MARLRRTSLSDRTLRSGTGAMEDVDPMSSMANLADVMLVFACGLMMALVVYWNIDISSFSELEDSQLEAIEDPEDVPEDLLSGGTAYVERGIVYQDSKTGKYYMLAEDAASMNDGPEASPDGNDDGASARSAKEASSSRSNAPERAGSGSSASGSSAQAPDRSMGAD